MGKCIFCKNKLINIREDKDLQLIYFNCDNCGEFCMTYLCSKTIREDDKAKCKWYLENNDNREQIIFDGKLVKNIRVMYENR